MPFSRSLQIVIVIQLQINFCDSTQKEDNAN